MALSHDPLWPRAGAWPAPDVLAAGERAALAVLGVPAWRTSLSPTGAHATPSAVREALQRYSAALVPDRRGSGRELDLAESAPVAVVDAGDLEEPDGPEGEARTRAEVARLRELADVVLAIGGDNSVTVAAALGAWGDGLDRAGLVTLDAHYDLRDGVSNGSPVRRLVEAGLDPSRIVQIGIADFANSAEYARRARELGITVIHRDELHGRAPAAVMAEALEIAGAAGGPVHLDLDVDVCDRSVVPGCPASMPGGLAAWELRAFARAAASDPRVASVDLAEVDATADAPDGRTVRLAALCVLEVLAGIASRPGRG
ncbi:arginase family protein [Agromyces soli]|uniref:Arginase family protein n=1 Tax=Agromyces soli TaxID=659012 RepID=A0ABY4B0J6_9MICO|nr:arginase family protein [Agromyces soli]UOE27588.1 arginase family protein [Agromyces soli]